jgi:hypothetical protein
MLLHIMHITLTAEHPCSGSQDDALEELACILGEQVLAEGAVKTYLLPVLEPCNDTWDQHMWSRNEPPYLVAQAPG